jgi:methyl-accepting chemotaxis protein
LLNAANAAQLLEKAIAAQNGFDKYVEDFTALARSEIALGLNEEAGRSGTLRAAVHDIEAKL